MSLSGALSNAVSGLTANARGTSVVSANIANALNENYGRRDIRLTTDAISSAGGVRVAQITRQFDPILAYQKRLATADHSALATTSAFDASLEKLVGTVDTIGSIAQSLTRMEAALLSAASDPSSQTRLRSVAFAAENVAASLREASDGLDAERSRADSQIAASVHQMNTGLERLEKLNGQIMTAKHLNQDALALMDERDALLDQLSEFVPLHVVERDSGAIAVFTKQGRTLLDGRAVTLSFDASPTILAHMSVSNGLLSRLSINDQPVDISGSAMMDGGSLAAQFAVRDSLAPRAQAQMDGIAREIIERFGAGGPDATLNPADAGVFTDEGAAFVAVNEPGLAGRISLNAILGSSSTELWRWRDGINAASEGDSGQSELLRGLQSQIVTPYAPSTTALGAQEQSLVGYLQNLSADASANRVRSEDARMFALDRLDAVRQSVAADGVNSDQELQKLIELEKSYAANARVVRVVDDMLSELLRI